MSGEAASERLLAAATRLFAEHGYDGASTRPIAEASGLNIATLNYHFGGKRGLYLAVMERAHKAERDALRAAAAEFTADRAGIHRFVDRYLDFCASRPEIPALWMHRWLSDSEDVAGLEQKYVRPVIDEVVALFAGAVRPGADLEYAVWTVIWCVHGFGRGGVLDRSGRRLRADDERSLARFRAHLHRLVDGMLGPS